MAWNVVLFHPPDCIAFVLRFHASVTHETSFRVKPHLGLTYRHHSYSSPSSSRSLKATSDDANLLAQSLGYLIGAGSLALYTPIAVRLLRQGKADGLTLSTWWLKLASYGCSDIYAVTHGYPLSTYVETLIITAEAAVILLLVGHYQKRMDSQFATLGATFALVAFALSTTAPPQIVAFGQASSSALNAGALVPQFRLNARRRTSGDYSPITAGLASAGCLIRLFTTYQLADSDPLLLGSFGLALCLNAGLLVQILWYGTVAEGRSISAVLMADLGTELDGIPGKLSASAELSSAENGQFSSARNHTMSRNVA